MKKSLFDYAQANEEKRNVSASIINNASIAYEDFLENRIRTLEEKNRELLRLSRLGNKTVASEGFVDKIKSFFNTEAKEAEVTEEDKEDWNIIDALIEQKAGLIEVQMNPTHGDKTLSFNSNILSQFSSAKELDNFLKWYYTLINFTETYYKALAQAHKEMVPLIRMYCDKPDSFSLIKNYTRIVSKVPNIDKIKSLGFKPNRDEKAIKNTNDGTLKTYTDNFQIFNLSYFETNKKDGNYYTFKVPHIDSFDEIKKENKSTSITLSEEEYKAFLTAFINIVDHSCDIFQKVFDEYETMIYRYASEIEDLGDAAERKHEDIEDSEYCEDYAIDISYEVYQGFYFIFFYDVFQTVSKMANAVLKTTR